MLEGRLTDRCSGIWYSSITIGDSGAYGRKKDIESIIFKIIL